VNMTYVHGPPKRSKFTYGNTLVSTRKLERWWLERAVFDSRKSSRGCTVAVQADRGLAQGTGQQ
jgi:hypothetical protein